MSDHQACWIMARPQEHYCAVTASTMPADRPPLQVEARNRISGGNPRYQRNLIV
jgi:hypothetical protein